MLEDLFGFFRVQVHCWVVRDVASCRKTKVDLSVFVQCLGLDKVDPAIEADVRISTAIAVVKVCAS